jgi:hypothetical protein
MTRAILIGLSLAVVLAACASPPETVGGGVDVSIPSDLTSPVDVAKSDLALRLGTAEGIVVVTAEDVVWPDGSLGCPQPGMSYTQALVDGYRIELSDGTSLYPYHGAVDRDPFLCENVEEPGKSGVDASPPVTLPASSTTEGSSANVGEETVSAYDGSLADLVAAAAADLADRLSVSLGDIVVVSADSVVWPDGSIGCPIPDMLYTQVQVDGAKIVLSVDGGLYNYHSGANRGPFLCVPTKASGEGTTGLTLPGTPDVDE